MDLIKYATVTVRVTLKTDPHDSNAPGNAPLYLSPGGGGRYQQILKGPHWCNSREVRRETILFHAIKTNKS